MRFRLTPRETSFYDMFAAAGRNLVVGAALLAELLAAPSVTAREEVARRMRTAEHGSDEITHEILRRLNTTFVTPFDREDIYELASRLDDIMDFMEAASDMVVLYTIGDLPDGVHEQVDVLRQCARLTADAMPRLRSMDDLAEYWVEINRLENQADKTHRRLVADIFSGGYDAITVLKLKDFYEQLEEAVDAFEDLANTIETIAVKES